MTGLLALMLLIEAGGRAAQMLTVRSSFSQTGWKRWDRDLIAEGMALITEALELRSTNCRPPSQLFTIKLSILRTPTGPRSGPFTTDWKQ